MYVHAGLVRTLGELSSAEATALRAEVGEACVHFNTWQEMVCWWILPHEELLQECKSTRLANSCLCDCSNNTCVGLQIGAKAYAAKAQRKALDKLVYGVLKQGL